MPRSMRSPPATWVSGLRRSAAQTIATIGIVSRAPQARKTDYQARSSWSCSLHQLPSRLAKTKSVGVIEDVNVSGMLKHHHLAQAIGDVGFQEFRRQLSYKAACSGGQVLGARRWEPTAKTCSACGWVDGA